MLAKITNSTLTTSLRKKVVPFNYAKRTLIDGNEYAFEMASSTTRFGRGVSREVGYDLQAMGITKKVCLVTDKTLVNLPPVKVVAEALRSTGIEFEIFDDVQVEPTDVSLKRAIEYCKARNFDAFVAVGGGSVIDTAKAANLYMCHPDADFLEFVNAPVGKGQPINKKLKPLIAVPTTAGTGSETTGVAIFDHMETGAKTGIRDRALRPTLGIVDPEHTLHCGPELTAFSGLDVLCHALESFTAVPYNKRGARPATPLQRPAYQGCNPVADIWSGYALQQASKYLPRVVANGDDFEAREAMCLAATAAGVGFGNAGVHLCHGMSYPIASKVKKYRPVTGYSSPAISKPAIVPHGLSVILTAPAVFRWTVSADPERHLRAAQLLGRAYLVSIGCHPLMNVMFVGLDVTNKKASMAGELLAEYIQNLLSEWKFVPNGLKEVGYSQSDIDQLVKGTLPQKKVLDIAPRQATPDDLGKLFEKSMTLF